MPRMEPSLRIGRRKSSCAAVLPTVEPKATPHEGDAMTSPGNPASAMASRTDSAESTATLPMVRLYLRGISLASIPSQGAPTRGRGGVVQLLDHGVASYVLGAMDDDGAVRNIENWRGR